MFSCAIFQSLLKAVLYSMRYIVSGSLAQSKTTGKSAPALAVFRKRGAFVFCPKLARAQSIPTATNTADVILFICLLLVV